MQRIWLSSVLAIVFSACTPSLQPIADIEGLATSAKLQLDIGTFQNPFSGKFTLYEAVACALKYNLDHRVSGCQSLEPSTATDKTYGTSDLKTTWNVLVKVGSSSRLTLIRERLNKLTSEARRDLLQAELKQAAAQVYASIGSDPHGTDINGNEDVAIIATSLRAHWEARKFRPNDDAEISAQAATRVLRNKYDNQT